MKMGSVARPAVCSKHCPLYPNADFDAHLEICIHRNVTEIVADAVDDPTTTSKSNSSVASSCNKPSHPFTLDSGGRGNQRRVNPLDGSPFFHTWYEGPGEKAVLPLLALAPRDKSQGSRLKSVKTG